MHSGQWLITIGYQWPKPAMRFVSAGPNYCPMLMPLSFRFNNERSRGAQEALKKRSRGSVGDAREEAEEEAEEE